MASLQNPWLRILLILLISNRFAAGDQASRLACTITDREAQPPSACIGPRFCQDEFVPSSSGMVGIHNDLANAFIFPS
ncbi:MAG: hypothetical protein D6690_01190 [Nitrospirae bacterium]|nr:MAG: hypothetical protein D6690_01190 [Nitrospirota bacterium]